MTSLSPRSNALFKAVVITTSMAFLLLLLACHLEASTEMTTLQSINKHCNTVDDALKKSSAEGLILLKTISTEQAALMIDILSIHKRTEDPFGISVVALPVSEVAKVPSQPVTSDELNISNEHSVVDITAAAKELKITGVDPSQNKFFIGSHPIYCGDTITVSKNGITYLFTVNNVGISQLELTEKDSGTKVTIPIYIIPTLHPKQISDVP